MIHRSETGDLPVDPIYALLNQSAPDRVGYVAQAAVAVLEAAGYGGNSCGVMQETALAIGTFAVATQQPELAEACFGRLDLPRQWELYAAELQTDQSAIAVLSVRQMCESTVEVEHLPEATKDDLLSLALIRKSQLDIAVDDARRGHQPQNLQSAVEALEQALEQLPDYKDCIVDPKNTVIQDAIHTLLKAGFEHETLSFFELLPEKIAKEYDVLTPLYRQHQRGKRLTRIVKKMDRLTDEQRQLLAKVFYDLSPKEYVEYGFRDDDAPGPNGLGALLQNGRRVQAIGAYEKALPNFSLPQSRAKSALLMAQHLNPNQDNQINDTVAKIEGFKAYLGLDTTRRGSTPMERTAIGDRVQQEFSNLLNTVKSLPFCEQRLSLTLDLARIKNHAFASNSESGKMCDQALFDAWKVIVYALTSESSPVQMQFVRSLWERFTEVGFDDRKLKAMSEYFFRNVHPDFS